MIIQINPIVIPGNMDLSRDILKNKRHSDNKPLNSKDLARYDFKTIFYDIFFEPTNNILYAVGPPLLNLKKELFPISLSVNSVDTSYRLLEFKQLTIVCTQVKRTVLKETNQVSIDFRGIFKWSGVVPKNKELNNAMFTLTALQKDNPLRWIRDWIEYYRKNHGIDRIFLYDNGSIYQSRLDRELDHTYVIYWNFPYGPEKSIYNKFCQIGSFNHHRLRFGNSHYCLNFDIDELLVVEKGNLTELLRNRNVVVLKSYEVPFIKPEKKEYSYKNFHWRHNDSRSTGVKYIYKYDSILYNRVHRVLITLQNSNDERSRFNYLKTVLRFFFYLIIGRDRSRNDIVVGPNITDRSVPGVYHVPLSEAYFLHYTGITTNWKSSAQNRMVSVSVDKKRMVKDIPPM